MNKSRRKANEDNRRSRPSQILQYNVFPREFEEPEARSRAEINNAVHYVTEQSHDDA